MAKVKKGSKGGKSKTHRPKFNKLEKFDLGHLASMLYKNKNKAKK
jgi:hypothetical protein